MTQVHWPSDTDGVGSAEALIKEARRRQRRRRASIAVAAGVVVIVGLSYGLFGHGGTTTRGSSSSSGGGNLGNQGQGRAATTSFVLVPTWLPPGFNTTGSGRVFPAGGLGVGSSVTTSASAVALFANGTSKHVKLRVPFTLTYYGSQEGEGIRVTAEEGMTPEEMASFLHTPGHTPGSSTVQLGGRRVTEGTVDSSSTLLAGWIEHGILISASAQGVSQSQFERFVRGLVERPSPPLLTVPQIPRSTSTTSACRILERAGFRCAKIGAPSQSDLGVRATQPAAGARADARDGRVPHGRHQSLRGSRQQFDTVGRPASLSSSS